MNVGVERRRDIGDVTVHEDLTRREADDLVGRYAAIGAADPEIFRRLRVAQALEVLWIFNINFLRPIPIVFEKFR